MNHYDIVFIGHLVTVDIVPFEGPKTTEQGFLGLYGAMSASCLPKKIALVTKLAEGEEPVLAPLRAAGVDLHVHPGRGSKASVVYPNANADERHLLLERRPGHFGIEDVSSIEPCLIHLVGFGDQEFSLEFMQALKERGFSLSMDIQSFIWKVDDQTKVIEPKDIPGKKEILSMVDFVKLDVCEAKVLTGADDIQMQATILENMGGAEIMITSSDGALAYRKGETHFAKFTNKSDLGRSGRGDTFTGAYLACRLDHSMEDSLKFAVALTSIKMESFGPFKGTMEDVLERMKL